MLTRSSYGIGERFEHQNNDSSSYSPPRNRLVPLLDHNLRCYDLEQNYAAIAHR